MKMEINKEKTKHITNTEAKLGMKVETLARGQSIRHLGYWINTELDFSQHLSKLRSRLYIVASKIRKELHDWESAVAMVNATIYGIVRFTAMCITIPETTKAEIDDLAIGIVRRWTRLTKAREPREILHLPRKLGGYGLLNCDKVIEDTTFDFGVRKLLNDRYDLGALIEERGVARSYTLDLIRNGTIRQNQMLLRGKVDPLGHPSLIDYIREEITVPEKTLPSS